VAIDNEGGLPRNHIDMQDRFPYTEPKCILITKMDSQHRIGIFQNNSRVRARVFARMAFTGLFLET